MRLPTGHVAFFLSMSLLPAFAQAQFSSNPPPADVTTPSADVVGNVGVGIPMLDESLIRTEDRAKLIFDGLLDPSVGTDPTRLSAAAKSIILNHKIAQQQVELVIQFLIANRDSIIAGNNADFNRIFGASTEKRRVAVLGSAPLPGSFNLVSSTVLQARPQQQQGGGGGQNQRPRIGNIGNSIRRGEILFLDNTQRQNNNNNNPPNLPQRQVYPDLSSTGFVVKVAEVINPNRGQQGGQQNNQNQNTDILLDPTFNSIPTNVPNRNNLTAWRVIKFEERNDSTIYEQVLSTYTAIRESLAGYDPSRMRDQVNQRQIQYNRRFRAIGDIRDGTTRITGAYATGMAEYTALNAIVDQFIPGRTADRLVRQAGLSLSDSHFHLDRLDDIQAGRTTDYLNRPVTPLLWTEDNSLPLQFDQNVVLSGATNEDRAFFRDRQTIFAGPTQSLPGVVDQYIGRAFLEETILHTGDFFAREVLVATDTALQEGVRRARDPERGQVLTLGGSNNTAQVEINEIAFVPESGTPTTSVPRAFDGTPMRRWQMILESFAEWGTDLTSADAQGRINIAAIGLMNIAGAGASAQIRASDAGNYALFADLIRATGGGSGIDFSRVEPLGKRANAGFNPVVPAN